MLKCRVFGFLAFLTLVLSGCGASNNYTSVAGDGDVLEQSVHIVGDSLWDYGGDRAGRVPQEIAELTKELHLGYRSIYIDHSLTNARVDDIVSSELPDLLADQEGIRTVLLNGGANNIKYTATNTACKTENNINTVSQKCSNLIIATVNKMRDVLTSIYSISTVEHVLLSSTITFPSATTSKAITEELNAKMTGLCAEAFNEGKCIFADISTLWSVDRADAIDPNHPEDGVDPLVGPDNIHVTDRGAQLVASKIWEVMTLNDVYR